MRAWLFPLLALVLLSSSRSATYAYSGSVPRVKGDLARVLAVLDQVLEADPNDTEIQGKRGLIRVEMGDLDGARADFDVVVEVFPKYAGAYVNRGVVYSLQEKWGQAHDDFDGAVRAEASDIYPAFYRCVAGLRNGRADAARKELAEAMGKRGNARPGDWPLRVGDFLQGKIDEAALLAAAEDKDPEKDSGQKCEAWYFAGVARLTAGQKVEAAECFRKSVATEQKTFTEYRLARGELGRLK